MREPITTLTSAWVALPNDDVDTDQIIPARFLKTTSKVGLDKQLFNDWRYDAQGNPNPDFILNQPRVAGAQGYEVRYESKKTGRSASAVKKAVKKVGNTRKRVEKRLGR